MENSNTKGEYFIFQNNEKDEYFCFKAYVEVEILKEKMKKFTDIHIMPT